MKYKNRHFEIALYTARSRWSCWKQRSCFYKRGFVLRLGIFGFVIRVGKRSPGSEWVCMFIGSPYYDGEL